MQLAGKEIKAAVLTGGSVRIMFTDGEVLAIHPGWSDYSRLEVFHEYETKTKIRVRIPLW